MVVPPFSFVLSTTHTPHMRIHILAHCLLRTCVLSLVSRPAPPYSFCFFLCFPRTRFLFSFFSQAPLVSATLVVFSSCSQVFWRVQTTRIIFPRRRRCIVVSGFHFLPVSGKPYALQRVERALASTVPLATRRATLAGEGGGSLRALAVAAAEGGRAAALSALESLAALAADHTLAALAAEDGRALAAHQHGALADRGRRAGADAGARHVHGQLPARRVVLGLQVEVDGPPRHAVSVRQRRAVDEHLRPVRKLREAVPLRADPRLHLARHLTHRNDAGSPHVVRDALARLQVHLVQHVERHLSAHHKRPAAEARRVHVHLLTRARPDQPHRPAAHPQRNHAPVVPGAVRRRDDSRAGDVDRNELLRARRGSSVVVALHLVAHWLPDDEPGARDVAVVRKGLRAVRQVAGQEAVALGHVPGLHMALDAHCGKRGGGRGGGRVERGARVGEMSPLGLQALCNDGRRVCAANLPMKYRYCSFYNRWSHVYHRL
eukprot:Rhum_TRINITY_DN15221_c3_g1::Rhum_TRINITY_DN15221_c3_g1_i1::g.143674::m.143674